jgi:SAM-dependent methyltransferase
MEAISCIFCGDVGARPYHEENGYKAVSCAGCGLVFVTPRPTEAEMKHLYEGQETKVDLGGLIRRVEAATAEAKRSLAIIRKYAARGRLLEIGSGAGYFLREAAREGFDVMGIDITRQFVEFSAGALGLDVREGTLASVDVPAGSVDIVYHRNVLSHLAYPIEAFSKMREILKPGGLVVFQTGNVAELPGARWAGTSDLDLPDHLFHYGEPTIRLLLARTGFDVLEVKRYVLVAHDAWVRALVAKAKGRLAATAARGSRAPQRPPPFIPPAAAPEPSPLRALAVSAEQLFTYGLGSIAESEGRRCTLIIVARAQGG